MSRSYVVTGAASGIGRAARELLLSRGHRVIGVDLHNADVIADLGTASGRAQLVEQVSSRAQGPVDGVLAIAGLSSDSPATVAVNYFGMVQTLVGLRPLLLGSAAGRAVGVASTASLNEADEELLALLLADDEPAALARAAQIAADPGARGLIYQTTKKAFAIWTRRNAATDDWAGASIPLNAIAPGVVVTPMVEPFITTEQGRKDLAAAVPMPLNGFVPAATAAALLAWLVSVENSHLCGQVVFIDGGRDVGLRGDSTW